MMMGFLEIVIEMFCIKKEGDDYGVEREILVIIINFKLLVY